MASAELESAGHKTIDFYGRLPNAVAQDCRIAPRSLALLAFKVTCAPAWRLEIGRLRREGWGKHALGQDRAILRKFGYLSSRKDDVAAAGQAATEEFARNANGRFCAPGEYFHPEVSPEPKSGYQIIRRNELFGLGLPPKSIGVLIWLRAMPGGAYIRELTDRFSQSAETCRQHLHPLVEAGFVEKVVRREDGRISGTVWRAHTSKNQAAANLAAVELGCGTSEHDEVVHKKDYPPSITSPKSNIPIEIVSLTASEVSRLDAGGPGGPTTAPHRYDTSDDEKADEALTHVGSLSPAQRRALRAAGRGIFKDFLFSPKNLAPVAEAMAAGTAFEEILEAIRYIAANRFGPVDVYSWSYVFEFLHGRQTEAT